MVSNVFKMETDGDVLIIEDSAIVGLCIIILLLGWGIYLVYSFIKGFKKRKADYEKIG